MQERVQETGRFSGVPLYLHGCQHNVPAESSESRVSFCAGPGGRLDEFYGRRLRPTRSWNAHCRNEKRAVGNKGAPWNAHDALVSNHLEGQHDKRISAMNSESIRTPFS
jgi:hypothetical protein